MLLLGSYLMSSCTKVSFAAGNTGGPTIRNITTSSKFLAKSDCINTSLTVTADVSGGSDVKSVSVWYRIGQDQKYTSTPMLQGEGNIYSATIVALDIPGGEYGSLEFYIIAKDEQRNQSKSKLDTSVELLPCVAN
jgi:hypothetical protein